jgi:hypothetical protein
VKYTLMSLLAASLTLGACGGGDSAGDAGDAGAGGTGAGGAAGGGASGGAAGGEASGGEGGSAPLRDVPWEGPIESLPGGAGVDARSYYPVPAGGVWRYRKRSASPENPEPVAQGGESSLYVHPDPDNPEREEIVRTTITIFDLPATADRPAQKIQQELKETMIVRPAEGEVGPQIRFKALEIEEREVGTGKFVRTLERTYDPPYTLIEDAWRVGLIKPQITERPRVKEITREHGQLEPNEQEFIGDVRVEAGGEDEALIMEGAYREKLRQIDVYDDVSQQATRSIWVQVGVGVVQWVYRDATNLFFTLVESNVEGE